MKKGLILILVAGIVFSLPSCSKRDDSKPSPTIKKEFEKTESSHFGFMPAHLDYKAGKESGGHWDRPFFERFMWDEIEKEPGQFDFSETDNYIQEAQEYGFHTLANIQSYNHWDQGDEPQEPMEGEPIQKPEVLPKDKKAYKNFVKKLVERYDGDGKDDMDGLKYPVKYWEIANEPEMQEPPLVFFKGTPKDYVEILKITREAVKEADSTAKIVQGGMAGMESFMVDFWQKVFDAGGTKYFDIANIHSIGHGEPLNIPQFKEFLTKNNIEKPFWVTEVQIEDREAKKTEKGYAESLARSYLYALANGAATLFYVNLRLPQEGLPPEDKGGPGFSDLSTLVSQAGAKQPLYHAHKTIANKLDKFDDVEILEEEISNQPRAGDRKILKGQYKFKVGDKTIYALWGKGDSPSELSGKIKVTEINGKEKTMEAADLKLTESPVLVEVLKN